MKGSLRDSVLRNRQQQLNTSKAPSCFNSLYNLLNIAEQIRISEFQAQPHPRIFLNVQNNSCQSEVFLTFIGEYAWVSQWLIHFRL